jgi:hypothetical protein
MFGLYFVFLIYPQFGVGLDTQADQLVPRMVNSTFLALHKAQCRPAGRKR